MNQLATMSDLVVKGIVKAEEDLRRENDDALWQEGLLRHVPIVGSIYNWISPVQKVTFLRDLRFDIGCQKCRKMY
jgi:hypothetical protein